MKISNIQVIRFLFGVIAVAAGFSCTDVFAQTKAAAPSITVYKTPT